MYEQLENKVGVAESLSSLGWLALWQGDARRAASLFGKALAAARESENQGVVIPRALNGLAVVASDAGDPERAKRLWEDALALEREQGDHFGVAMVLINMGFAEIALGNYEQSTALAEEALALGHKLNTSEILAMSLLCMGLNTTLQGEPERAKSMLKESLAIDMARESKSNIAEDLEALAVTAGALRQQLRAARLWGAAEALREVTGAEWGLSERMVYEPPRDAARFQLDDEAWEKAFAKGKAMRLEEAVEYALSEEEHATSTPPALDPSTARVQQPALTRREEEIAALAARGMTNRQIAAELVISEHTAATHVRRILKKLGLRSRVELAGWVSSSRPPLT
jgi:DNA-binding CsgD family transcriptional regulator/Tfp pilus assembly protein PilF